MGVAGCQLSNAAFKTAQFTIKIQQLYKKARR